MEDQVAEKQEAVEAPGTGRKASAAKADVQRQRQALELQRERILDERTSNPHRRAALGAALADIEKRLNTLS